MIAGRHESRVNPPFEESTEPFAHPRQQAEARSSEWQREGMLLSLRVDEARFAEPHHELAPTACHRAEDRPFRSHAIVRARGSVEGDPQAAAKGRASLPISPLGYSTGSGIAVGSACSDDVLRDGWTSMLPQLVVYLVLGHNLRKSPFVPTPIRFAAKPWEQPFFSCILPIGTTDADDTRERFRVPAGTRLVASQCIV